MQATRVVRKALRESGVEGRDIWTNKLKDPERRTVKCYVIGLEQFEGLQAKVETALLAAGYRDYEIRFLDADWYTPADSMIIEVPYDVEEELA